MGDISEIRGLLVIGSFLAVLVFLISIIPSQFIPVAYTGKTVDVPEFFDAVNLEMYALIYNYTLDGTGSLPPEPPNSYVTRHEIGGNTFYIDYAKPNETVTFLYGVGIFEIRHVIFWWIFETGAVIMKIDMEGDTRGNVLDRTELDADYVVGNTKYGFEAEYAKMDVLFAFNETAYSTPSEAFDDEDLRIVIGLTWDQINTSMSAWDVIALVLFFQLPEVHWIINAIIGIPLWIGIIYISYILLLRAIGAVFGGGGA